MSTRLEQNAKRLSYWEDALGDLGPLRKIVYFCKLQRRDLKDAFSLAAQRLGFLVADPEHWIMVREYDLTASIQIEPTASKITELEAQLESLVEKGDPEAPSIVTRWRFSTQRIWLRPSESNEQAAEARAAALFGSELVEDPLLSPPLSGSGELRPSFKLLPSEFLRKALTMRPRAPKPTASAFSQWIYSLYGQAEGSEEDIAEGREAEKEIWERRRIAANCNDNSFLRASGRNWSLVHNGLHLHDRDIPPYFAIPHLRVKGEPLRVSPDLVYQSGDRARAIVVEIKFSKQPIPKNLWPNVWGQLWCYAQFEDIRKAKSVTAVGEVWGEDWPKRNRGRPNLYLRALVRRNPRAPAYDRFFRKLFDIYAGHI